MWHLNKGRETETKSHVTLVTHFILQRQICFRYFRVLISFRNNF